MALLLLRRLLRLQPPVANSSSGAA
eukprot:COSAG01_NODE_37262_length_506_cov_0.410319_2_plen_24_part_01